jgi:glycosyltransferase involved in cell wall biosynthesis
MKIAHLVSGGEPAGGQAVALTLARAARAAGHEPLFLSPTAGPFVTAAAEEGFATDLVDVTRTFRLHAGFALCRLLRRLQVDLLHTHVHLAAGVLGRLAGRAAKTDVIAHLHIENHLRAQRLARAPLVALDNSTARLCTRLLTVSDATRRAFERQGIPPDLMETVHNGVDVGALENAGAPGLRRRLGLPAEAIVVGHVGRLAPVKGQRELLEAVARLSPRLAQTHVVLIGKDIETGGAYGAELERLAASLGISVHFTGYCADASAAIQELDVLALPSWIEGLPLVVLEAMAHAKPVIATAVGGTPEAVLDDETGLLVAPRDVDALTRALERVLADGDLRRRLGRAGRARVGRHFAASAMAGRVLEIYADLARR